MGESKHHILDGHFSNIFVVKIVLLFIWKDKNKWKKAGDGPFKKVMSQRNDQCYEILQNQYKPIKI